MCRGAKDEGNARASVCVAARFTSLAAAEVEGRMRQAALL